MNSIFISNIYFLFIFPLVFFFLQNIFVFIICTIHLFIYLFSRAVSYYSCYNLSLTELIVSNLKFWFSILNK